MAANDSIVDRPSLRLAAMLMLTGQILYAIVTLFHTGGEANDHLTIFAAYAASRTWTAVHVAQFACMSAMLAGIFAFFFALDVRTAAAKLAARFGAASTTVALGLYGAVLAVDGVALKQAVDAWVRAPEGEKAERFIAAETVRWLEWGMRSYENFAIGLAVLLLAAAAFATSGLPRAIALLITLSGFTYLAQGWLAGAEGFSPAHTYAIILAEVINAVWMTWLLVVAWSTDKTVSTDT